MAQTLKRLLVLWFCFTVEIHVHASASEHEPESGATHGTWLSTPAHCNPGTVGCAYRAKAAKLSLTWEGAEISVSEGAVVAWQSGKTMDFVAGTGWIRFHDGAIVSVPSARISGEGEMLIQKDGAETEVTCISGEVRVAPLGASGPVILPAGFRVRVGPVTRKDGAAEMDVPQTAPTAATVKAWWAVYPGTKESFLPLAKQFTATVVDAADKAGPWHFELVQRQVASQREEERKAAARRRKAEAENKQMRDLFRKLNYLGDELPDQAPDSN
jgi:hypothetical protein